MIMWFALLLLVDAPELARLPNLAEQQRSLQQHASTPQEGLQHWQAALSLRNQQLFERQAESRARQLQYQLQAAQALAAIDALQEQQQGMLEVTADSGVAPPRLAFDLQRLRLLALTRHQGQWLARLSYGERVVSVRHDSWLNQDIRVAIDAQQIVLSRANEQHVILVE